MEGALEDGPVWRLPAYGSACFDMLPATVLQALTGTSREPTLELGRLAGRYDRVVIVYFDAFGWLWYERHAAHPLLERARHEGWVSKLTSQFPSTTAAHMTTIHSGVPVGVHGVYEWFMFLPKADRIIAPLMFSFAGDALPGTLLAAGVTPGDVYPDGDFYPALGNAGIAAHVALPGDVAASTPAAMLLGHAAVHPFSDVAEGMAAVGNALGLVDRGYGFVYLPDVDSAMHHLGPDHPAVEALIDETLSRTRADPGPGNLSRGNARARHRRSRHGGGRPGTQPVRQRDLARDRRPHQSRRRRATARARGVQPRSLPAHPFG